MGRAMRQILFCALVVAALSVSDDEIASLGDGAVLPDTGVDTNTDGEMKLGRYGDYSDWIRKYRIGPHHPFHATPGGLPVKQQKRKAKKPAVGPKHKAKRKPNVKKAAKPKQQELAESKEETPHA